MRPEDPTKVERTPWREEDDDSISSRSSNDDERVAAAFFIEKKSDCKVNGNLIIAIIHHHVSELPYQTFANSGHNARTCNFGVATFVQVTE